MNDVRHLDYDTLNALKDVMEDEFAFLVETYLKDSADRLAVLRDLLVDKNADAIRRAAHSFKGSSSNLGAIQLMSLCARLETKALADDLDSLEDYINQIETEFLVVKQKMLDYLG